MSEEIIKQIDDRLEKRFESYAQAQQAIHEDYHQKMLKAVEQQIKTTVNGKVDKIQATLDDMSWLADFSRGAGLMKKPMMWFIAFVLGTVALFGGLKSLLGFFLPTE